jgi:hypothetical protein
MVAAPIKIAAAQYPIERFATPAPIATSWRAG